jgi:hypothetical protein
MANANVVAHLNMLQSVISRMNQNSFQLKGWSVVLVSALFALSVDGKDISFVLFAFFPAIVLWGLDAYYLRQERLFRGLYNNVRVQQETDFSMDTSTVSGIASWLSIAWSPTVKSFHGVIVIVVSLVTLAMKL